jgi:hypothetical protein
MRDLAASPRRLTLSLALAAGAVFACAARPAAAQGGLAIAQAPPAAARQAPPAVQPPQAPSASAADISFPPTPVGQTSSVTCASLCVTDPSGAAGNCNGSGTISITKPLAAPFSIGNFRTNTTAGSCTGTAATLPVNLSPGEYLVYDFAFAPTSSGSFSDTLTFDNNLTYSLTGDTTAGAPCTANSTTLCLNNNRFQVQAAWRTSDGTSGQAETVTLTTDTGYMWFFSSDNVEVVIKVLDGCPLNNSFWVFAGGLTNVRVVITVTDTVTGTVRTFVNPQGTAFQPIQDTSAFTCP